MGADEHRLFDGAAGPVVRLFAMTRGRTRPRGVSLDVISVVFGADPASVDRSGLDPEHLDVLAACRQPTPVADVAVATDLPLGVVRVLLDDLYDRGLLEVRQPAATALQPVDEQIIRQVLDGLRAL